MKVIIVHTDFRIYWFDRLKALNSYLQINAIDLHVIEIASKGSPYNFAENSTNNSLNWTCLFPEQKIEDLSTKLISKILQKKIDEIKPDIVIAGAIAFPSGAGALKWKAKTGKPIIIFDDARPEDVPRNLIINTVKRIFFQMFDAVICPAPSHAISFLKFGISQDAIFYGVDVVNNEMFKKNNQVYKATSPEIPKPYILAIGRQIEKKNWTNLLEAFIGYKNLSSESILNLVFIGDGPLNQTLIKTTNANQRKDIIFLPFIQQTSIIHYYHSACALILPSKFGETWGLVVNEAMAAGLPVLVSNKCGCAPTLVHEAKNGWTFDPENIQQIADAIRKIDHLSKDEWDTMSQASVEIIKDWGLPRFTQGVLDAILYVSLKPHIKSNYFGKILTHFWNGRYRPV